ncbi:GAP1-N1 domain-containing protein [Tardiphaga sp. 285_C5_N1_2]|uniref:GAP1-N1 domain-containing protein n=1 Tax=Tardiphaga sp. 285_C5_N1_2 TaxID=3240775 RepID=UPI003F8CA034
MSTTRSPKLQQALHGYSDGHRLLASSIDLVGRDAKTMLMMSDASGPAAVIGDDGYLTAYPLSESGYYAFARTWPAPEMPRPGCVWTHTILIEFSDIPALQSASGLLDLFRRPHKNDRDYDIALTLSEGSAGASPPNHVAARQILWAIYHNPSRPIVSSILGQRERDELVLAMWDQQWPRLKRAFRFCTLSFADRSAGGNVFDLQFLPSSGRVPRAQFRTALDADRSEVEFPDWLDNAVADLRDGPPGDLRRFLRTAGSDVSGREAFVPLASLYALSKQFATAPDSIEQAISILEETIPDSQGQAARTLITHAAGSTSHNLSSLGLQFVLKHFDLIDESQAATLAENIGKALWTSDPGKIMDLLSEDSSRRKIAARALATLPLPVLIQGAAAVPQHRVALFDARPDLGTAADFWALPDTWSAAFLRHAAEHHELAPAMITAMIHSARPSVREACSAFGRENVLRRLLESLDGDVTLPPANARSWLTEASLDPEAVARCLCNINVTRASTLDALAHVITPDFVPNALGDDPWLLALRRMAASDLTQYLASFLLTRAFGRRTRKHAELVQLSFDTVFASVQQSALPDEAWRLLDDRLYRSYFWPSWDRNPRITQTTVDLYVDNDLDPGAFVRITAHDGVFALLVDVAARSFRGQRYLKSARDRLSHDGRQSERLRIIKQAIW